LLALAHSWVAKYYHYDDPLDSDGLAGGAEEEGTESEATIAQGLERQKYRKRLTR